MLFNKTRDDVLAFVRARYVATVATVKDGGAAHAATVYYYVDNDLNFYFLTRDETMKFKNIKSNRTAALVITDVETLQTVQVEGSCEEVDYRKVYAPIVESFVSNLQKIGRQWEKLPINHILKGYYAFVKIKPTWIRWSDYKDWEHTTQFEWAQDSESKPL